MGGHQVSGEGPGDDGYDEDGYDESQRAEILEVTRDGPSNGTILLDVQPDVEGAQDDEDEDIDDLEMTDDEVGEEDEDVDADEEDDAEDDLQEDFDEDDLDEEELGDGDDAALRP